MTIRDCFKQSLSPKFIVQIKWCKKGRIVFDTTSSIISVVKPESCISFPCLLLFAIEGHRFEFPR